MRRCEKIRVLMNYSFLSSLNSPKFSQTFCQPHAEMYLTRSKSPGPETLRLELYPHWHCKVQRVRAIPGHSHFANRRWQPEVESAIAETIRPLPAPRRLRETRHFIWEGRSINPCGVLVSFLSNRAWKHNP